jgi:hypothetical protein
LRIVIWPEASKAQNNSFRGRQHGLKIGLANLVYNLKRLTFLRRIAAA